MPKNKNVELEMWKIGPFLCFVIPICRIKTYLLIKGGSISPVGVSSYCCYCVTLDLLSTPLLSGYNLKEMNVNDSLV